MASTSNNLIWIDLEMSGLSVDTDTILEVAVLVTDPHLTPVDEGISLVVHQPDSVLAGMDEWNTKQHGQSGLVEDVKASTLSIAEAEEQVLEHLRARIGMGVSPMCGNTICMDRRFLVKYMPRLEEYFHYRNLDVSTLKELARRWRPEVFQGMQKQAGHRGMSDVLESIEELAYYRDNFLQMP